MGTVDEVTVATRQPPDVLRFRESHPPRATVKPIDAELAEPGSHTVMVSELNVVPDDTAHVVVGAGPIGDDFRRGGIQFHRSNTVSEP